ncbi:MAG: hypothetical protein DRJ10_11305 [Bacteroidetes bacterium]|nr:MAG: hypothetical protein DRJ10_11305 [Bacteroidota bacterium]
MNNCKTCQGSVYTRRDFVKKTTLISASLCVGMNLISCKKDTPVTEKNYYIQKKDELLNDFDELSLIVKNILLENFPLSRVNKWKDEAKKEYSLIIPQLPYVGGDDSDFTRYLILSAAFIPYLKILRENGISTRQIGKLIFDASKIYYNREISKVLRPAIKWYTLSGFNQNSTKELALKTQLRKYKEDWVMEFVKGEEGKFEYGINYKECGLVKLYKVYDVAEFTPYLCLTDYSLLTLLGIELKRTHTIANGAASCDFRFINNDKGPTGWPPESLPEWTGKFES